MQRYAAFVWVCICFVLIYVAVQRARKKLVPELRRLPQLEVYESAIKRCAEMGRPLMMLAGIETAGTYAGGVGQGIQVLSTISYTAKIAAEQGTEAHYVANAAGTIPFMEDAIETACRTVGKPEEVRRQRVYCWGLTAPGVENFAACAEWIRFSHYAKPGTSIMFMGGGVRPMCNYLDGSRSIEGNFIIGGTGDCSNMGWFAAIADYWIMPEEILGMGVYVNKDPIQVNTLLMFDIFRYGIAILVIALATIYNLTKLDVSAIMKL